MARLSFIFTLIFVFAQTTYAASFELPNLSEGDLEKSSKEFLSNFTHTSVSPPGGLGAIFGVEVGAVGGITDAPDTGALINEVDQDNDIDSLPHAGILGRVTTPFNVTFEGLIVPEQDTEDAEFSHLSLGVQWDLYQMAIFDFAAKAHYGSSDFSFNQEIGSDADGKVTYDNSTYGLMALVGADFLVLNPYAGLGFVKGDSELSFEASSGNDLFDFTTANSSSVDETSAQFLIGAQLDLTLLHLAAEYSNQFGADRISGKVSLAF